MIVSSCKLYWGTAGLVWPVPQDLSLGLKKSAASTPKNTPANFSLNFIKQIPPKKNTTGYNITTKKTFASSNSSDFYLEQKAVISKYGKGKKWQRAHLSLSRKSEKLFICSAIRLSGTAPSCIWILKGNNPPQIAYLHASRKTGFCVYIDKETKKVRSYMPVSNVKRKIKELKIKSGAI